MAAKSASAPADNSELYSYKKSEKVEVGEVERFFSKVGVAAIRLTGELKIGDTVEMEGEDGPMRV